MLDVVIKGGELVDGTGAARRRADVGIADGRVVEIGEINDGARRTIDAEGRIVAPGFIDIHTHYDVQGFWDPNLTPSPLHGVTSVVGGNCGFTVAPLNDESASYLMRTLAKVEGIPLASLEAGVPWNWRTTAEFFDRLDGTLSINTGFLVGHTAMRRVVMGEDATRRTSTPEELEEMCALLRDGLRAGGMGFSTSRGSAHQDANGDPVPSRHAAANEFVELAAVCREFAGTSLEFIPSDYPFPDEDLDIAISMSLAGQRPLNWNVLSTTAESLETDLATLTSSDAAARRGAKIFGLAIPMDLRVLLSFATGYILDSFPGWAEVLSLPIPQRIVELRKPEVRQTLKANAKNTGQLAGIADWGIKMIAQITDPELKRYERRQISEIAAEEGKDDFDALLDIVCADDLQTLFFTRPPNNSPADWEARARVWRDDRALIGGSDAGAHCDLTAQAQYATTLLAGAVRDHQIFTLEEAVEQLTSRPADLYGIRDRGRLTVGAHADVVIFDEERIASGPVENRADFPGGASRLVSDAIGVDEVLVNGTTIVAAGAFTEARPGRLFRSGTDTYTPSLS
jgi:N-acyl-D-aspartate/D-glutamate deacylase